MIHSSDVPFFISAPQIISSLGFMMGVCDPKDTKGLVKSLTVKENKRENKNNSKDKKDERKHDYLVDHTLKFVHKWSAELRTLLTPGDYYRERRVYAHPKYVNPRNENTFQLFRWFRVEEKIFDGPEEVMNWVARTLKTEISPLQKIFILWSWEQSNIDRMKEKRMVEEISTKVQSKKKTNENKKVIPNQLLPTIPSNSPSLQKKKEICEMDTKTPILAWISHAVVEIPDEFFDGEKVYTYGNGEYLKVHDSPSQSIRIYKANFDFNTIIIPTQNLQLVMLILYDYEDSKLCPLIEMRNFASSYFNSKGPCLVRKQSKAPPTVIKSIYIPNWRKIEFPANRIAHHLVATMNLHSIFVPGGFGDLAIADAIPSATGDPKQVSHLQHYGLLSLRNSPKREIVKNQEVRSFLRRNTRKKTGLKIEEKRKEEEVKKAIPYLDLKSPATEVVHYPICVILWDKNRNLPAYMGKVTGNEEEEEMEETDEPETTDKK
ncbi:hypothetical protein GCK72_010102 [Caenorhabditis remanei]|uniref:Uncharacterized protein n=1 Tax=Caenorhabditis remanei TaxID=31234 RepID=A0A6A5H5P9_CAERE|nr:hypothetical protein GCK72_010102 [Caenorhabditis remanei]KAF1761843.1 hypothetical protein GCK72_010102 [Caenorhabditis remanei]